MAGGTVVRCVSTHRLAGLGRLVNGAIGVDGLLAVVLVTVLAINALAARICLRTNTDTVTDLDVLDVLADLDSLANNLVANAAC